MLVDNEKAEVRVVSMLASLKSSKIADEIDQSANFLSF